jgi:uncharacterized protein with ParB-like and HNH nuclease domain
MQTELFSLSKIFTENLFRIPDYQRGYSWTIRQLKDFWSDLALLESDRDHYTGVLTLEEVSAKDYSRWTDDIWIIKSKRYKPYYVVDGQQRLTTSLILIQALLEQIKPKQTLNYSTADEIKKKYIYESRDNEISKSYIFGYEKDNPSYEFLKTKIFLEKSDNHELRENTIYTHNLLNAKRFFSEQLAGRTNEQLAEIYMRITQHFLFNIYTMGSGVEVFVAFETMNNRGKPLSHLELLKTRLIFLSTRLGSDDTDRSKVRAVVNEAWKSAYHYLGKNKENPLDDNDFMAAHLSLFVGPLLYDAKNPFQSMSRLRTVIQSDKGFNNYLLDRIFSSRNIPRTTPDTIQESPSEGHVEPAFPLSGKVLYDYAHRVKESVFAYYQIMNPSDSEFSDEQKLALARLNRLGWHETEPLGLAIVLAEGGDNAGSLLSLLERTIFLRFVAADPSSYGYLAYFLQLAVELGMGKLTLSDLQTQMTDLIAEQLKNFTLEFFQRSLRTRGYYGWQAIRYFLFEYEQELKRRARTKRDKITWNDFISENYDNEFRTVEHILPVVSTGAYWKERFGHLKSSQRSALKHSLGNLVALSTPRNSSFGNRSFPEKKQGTSNIPGYVAGSYSEIEVAQYDDWTPDTIAERGLKMLKFMERRWGFTFDNDEARLRALGLGFLVGEEPQVEFIEEEGNEA